MFDFFFRGEKLDEAAYVKRLKARIAEHAPALRFEHDAASSELRGVDPAQRFFLGNMHKDYLRAPQHKRDALLTRHALMCATPPSLPEAAQDYERDVRAHLLPIVRSRANTWAVRNLAPSQLGTDAAPRNLLHTTGRALGDDRAIYLAFDTEHAMTQVSDTDLERWGVDFERALADAIANLRAASVPKWQPMEGGFFRGHWEDSYDCSRIALPELFAALPLGGARPVAMVPARTELLVAPGHDVHAQLAMLHYAAECLDDNSRWCAASLIVLAIDGGWVPHHAADAGVREAESDLRNRILSNEYATQKQALDRENERTGSDLFIASFMAYEDSGTGHTFSICSWSEGVDTWLPKTDRVCFLENGGADGKPQSVAIVAWDAAVAIAGALLREVDGEYPPRFHVDAFPDAAMRERLRAAAPD